MALKILAQFISIVFHPLLQVSYALVFLLLINPFSFGVSSFEAFWRFTVLVFFSTFFVPALSILMLKQLKFVNTLRLDSSSERIAPFIIAGVFYGWLYINLRHSGNIPPEFQAIVLGSVISLTITFIINLFYKLSLHATGMGGMMATAALLSLLPGYRMVEMDWFNNTKLQIQMLQILIYIIIATGLVGSARLYLNAHDLWEWFSGFVVGVISMLIAFTIIL